MGGCRKGNLKRAIRTRKGKQRQAQRIAKMLEEDNQEKEAQITAKREEEDRINQRRTERKRKIAIKAQRRHEKQQLLIAEEAELMEMYAEELDANENNNNYPKQTKQKKRSIVDRWKDQCQKSAQSKIKEAQRRRLDLSVSVYCRYGPGRKSCRYCLGWGHDFENCHIRKHDWIMGEEQIFPGRNSFGRPETCQPQPNIGAI